MLIGLKYDCDIEYLQLNLYYKNINKKRTVSHVFHEDISFKNFVIKEDNDECLFEYSEIYMNKLIEILSKYCDIISEEEEFMNIIKIDLLSILMTDAAAFRFPYYGRTARNKDILNLFISRLFIMILGPNSFDYLSDRIDIKKFHNELCNIIDKNNLIC